ERIKVRGKEPQHYQQSRGETSGERHQPSTFSLPMNFISYEHPTKRSRSQRSYDSTKSELSHFLSPFPSTLPFSCCLSWGRGWRSLVRAELPCQVFPLRRRWRSRMRAELPPSLFPCGRGQRVRAELPRLWSPAERIKVRGKEPHHYQ